jgi:hypothetical protein
MIAALYVETGGCYFGLPNAMRMCCWTSPTKTPPTPHQTRRSHDRDPDD